MADADTGDADTRLWESLLLTAANAEVVGVHGQMESHLETDTAANNTKLNKLKGLEQMKHELKEAFIKENLDEEEQGALIMNLSNGRVADDFVDTLEKIVKKRIPKGEKLLTIKERRKRAYATHKNEYIHLKSLYDNLKRADQLLLRENLSFYDDLVKIINRDDDLELSGFIGLLLFVNSTATREEEAMDVDDYLRIHNMEILNNVEVKEKIKSVLKRRQAKYICNTNLLAQKSRLKKIEDSPDNDLVIGVIDHPLGPGDTPTTSLIELIDSMYNGPEPLSEGERAELDTIFHLEGDIIVPNPGIPNKLLRTINFKIQGSKILNAGSATVLPGVPGNKTARDYFEVCDPTQQCRNVGIQRMSTTNFMDYKKIKDNGQRFLDLLNSPHVAPTIHENMKTNTNVKPCYICNHKIISATQLNRAKLGNNSNECEHVVPCVVFTLMFGLACPQDAARVKDFIAGARFGQELAKSWIDVPGSYLGGVGASPKEDVYATWIKINHELCEKEYFSSHALCNKTKTNDDYILIDPINIYGILTPEEYETWLPEDGSEEFKHGDFDNEFDASEIVEANAAIQKLKKAKDQEGERFGFKCKYDYVKVRQHLQTILEKEGKTVASTSICGMFKREMHDKKKNADKKKCYIGEKAFSSSIIEDGHFIKKKHNTSEKIQKAQLEQIFKYGVAPPYSPPLPKTKSRTVPVPEKNGKWRCPAPTIPPLTAAGKPSVAKNAKHKDRNILDLSSLYFPNDTSVSDSFENYHAYLHTKGVGICDGIGAAGGLTATDGAKKWIDHRINSIRVRCLLLVGAVYKYPTEALAFNYWLTSRAYLNNYMSITTANRAMPAPDTLLSSNSLPYISIQKAIDTVKARINTVNNEPTLSGGGHYWKIDEHTGIMVPATSKAPLVDKDKEHHTVKREKWMDTYTNLNIACPETGEDGICRNWATVGRCYYRHTKNEKERSSKMWRELPESRKTEYVDNLEKWRRKGIEIAAAVPRRRGRGGGGRGGGEEGEEGGGRRWRRWRRWRRKTPHLTYIR